MDNWRVDHIAHMTFLWGDLTKTDNLVLPFTTSADGVVAMYVLSEQSRAFWMARTGWSKISICMGLLLVIGLLTGTYHTLASAPGFFDGREQDFAGGLVNLDGHWEFYWDQLLEPADFAHGIPEGGEYVAVPGAWNGYHIGEQDLLGQGYGTYRVQIQVDHNQSLLGLRLPRILTAYRLWVDGGEVAGAGRVGRNRSEVTPQYLTQQAFFYPSGSTVELVIQVSNFHHRSGGILESIQLGTADSVQAATKRSLAYDLFLFGSLVIMGVYHLVLFLYRRSEWPLLYFGLFCVLVGLRTLFVGQIFFTQLFPAVNWELAHKAQTLTYYLGVHVIILFFKGVFPTYVSGHTVQVSAWVVSIFSASVLLLPARYFTIANPVFQVFTLLVIGCIIGVLARVARGRERGTAYLVLGAALLFLTVAHDILFLSILRSDHQAFQNIARTGNLSALGMLGFVFTHSLVLAIKYSQAFHRNEELASELAAINENLETTVERRTKDLQAANSRVKEQKRALEEANHSLAMLSLKDPLTELWNRRHFEEALATEWKRSLRRGESLALIFIDIDEFKAFNDQYGHRAGDECLIRVAQSLRGALKRTGDIAVRYGGEEFVVLLPMTANSGAAEVAEAIRHHIGDLRIPQACSVQEKFVTVSLGVASAVPADDCSPEDLVTAADRAMYKAKQKGKNRMETVVVGAVGPMLVRHS